MRRIYLRIIKDRTIGTWSVGIHVNRGMRVGYLGSWLTYDQARLAVIRFLTAAYR